MNRRKAAIVLLGACAVSDLAAVPLLLGDTDHIPAAAGVRVAVLGFLTVAAAVGIARRTPRARGLALSTRIVDIISALPACAAGAGAGVVAAALVTVVISVAAITFLSRLDPAPAVAPGLSARS